MLNATSVGNSFLLLAQIKVRLVANVIQYNCHMFTPKIRPGMITAALAVHEAASTLL